MIDFATLTTKYVVVVVVACLVVGYIIKHASFLKKISNDDIPVILAFTGAIINVIVSGLSVESVVYGAVMGLASTGMHQSFKNFVEGSYSKTPDTYDDEDSSEDDHKSEMKG